MNKRDIQMKEFVISRNNILTFSKTNKDCSFRIMTNKNYGYTEKDCIFNFGITKEQLSNLVEWVKED